MVLVIDIETSGLPARRRFDCYYSYKNIEKYDTARVLQVAVELYSGDFLKTKQQWFIDFEGAIPNSEIHGITRETLDKNGLPFREFVHAFEELVDQADLIVGHNVSFDVHVLCSELYRHDFKDLANTLIKKERFCTMECGKTICDLKTAHGQLKSPKLTELYHRLFRQNPIGTCHDASNDVAMTSKCYLYMKRRLLSK